MKEAAKAGKIQLFFQDESGMANHPNVQRAWSPVGMPHEADASIPRKRINILGALNYGANTLTYKLHETSVSKAKVIDFLDNLAATHSKSGVPIIVVLDNASIHGHIPEEKEREWLVNHKMLLWHIPPYSPELNIIEILWKHAKYHWRAFTTWTRECLAKEVDNIFGYYGKFFKIDYA
jgi:transposase